MCFCCLFLLGQETWPPSEVPEIQVTQTSGAPTSIVELNVVNNVAFFVPYQRPGDTTMTALVNGEQTIELVVVDAYEARLPVPWFDISETQMMDVTIDDVTVQIQVDPPPAVADVPALVAELKTKTTQVLELMKVRTELAAVEAPANEHLRVQLAMDILVTWKDDFNTQMDLLLTRSPAEQQAIASVFQASDLLSVYDDYLAVSAGDDPDCSEFGKLVELEGYFDKGSAVTKAATSIALVIKGLCLVTGFPCIAVDTVSNIGSGLAIGSAVGDVVTPSQGDMEAYTPEPNLDLAGEAGIIDVTADLNTRDNDLADLWNIIGGILGRVSWTTNETVSYGYDVFLDAAGTQIPDYDADFVIREEFDLPVDVTKLISEMDPNGVVGLENGEFCNRLRVNPLQVGDVDIKLVFPSFTVPLESNTLHFIVVNAPLVERLTGIANGTYEGSMFNIHGDLGTYKVRIAGTQQDVDPCNPRVEISGADTDNATITVRGCHHEFIGQGSGSVRLAWVKANGQQRIPLESVSWQYSSGFADGGAGDNGYAETYLGRQDHGLVTYINGGTLMMGGEKICLFGPSDGSFQGSMYLGARALSDYHGEDTDYATYFVSIGGIRLVPSAAPEPYPDEMHSQIVEDFRGISGTYRPYRIGFLPNEVYYGEVWVPTRFGSGILFALEGTQFHESCCDSRIQISAGELTLYECHHKYSPFGIDMGYGSVDLAWYNNNGTAIDSFLTNRILWNVSYAGDLGTGFTKWKLGLAENGLVDTGSIAPGDLLLEEPDHLALVNDGQDDLFFKAEEWSDDISEECNESTITVSNLRADILPETKRYMAREEARPNGIEVIPLPEGAVPVIE